MKTDEKEKKKEKKIPLGRTLYCNFLMLAKIWHMTPQYIVFMVLWENDGQTVGDICRKLYLDSGTVTPLLKKMEEAGYVTRTRQKEDERVVTVRLTDKGRDMQAVCEKIPEDVGSCVPLDPEDGMKLYDLLYRTLEAVCNE